jgi:hypothetical protein
VQQLERERDLFNFQPANNLDLMTRLVLFLFVCFTLIISATEVVAVEPDVTRESRELRLSPMPADWNLNLFYKKHVNVGGLPVLASEKVSNFALFEAAYLINQMLAERPDILKALADNRVRFAVIAWSERTTDIPEHSDLKPGKYWDRRARGLGSTKRRPAVSCGEENLLGYPGDPYAMENILVHEFAHAIHQMGLNSIDKTFDERLKETYRAAMDKGLWKDKYAAQNHSEYWAEGVQSWFDTNRPPDHDHNHVDTREELEEYDPALAALVSEVFRGITWRYQRPAQRTIKGHLAGYDPKTAPTFAWDLELQKWYDEYQKEQKQKSK